MSKICRNHSAAFKAKVALEALAGEQTIAELAAKHGVYQTLINEWKRLLTQDALKLFERRPGQAETANDHLTSELYKQIGQLKVENGPLGNAEGGIFCPEGSDAECKGAPSHDR